MHRIKKPVICVLYILMFALIVGVIHTPVFASLTTPTLEASRRHWAQDYTDILYAANVMDETDIQVSTNNPVSNQDMIRWVGNVLGRINISENDEPITRLDAFVMMAQLFFMELYDYDILLQFPDYHLIPLEYRPYIAALVSEEIVRGHGSGRMAGYLDPLGILTHGQAAALIAMTTGVIYFESGLYINDVLLNGVINVGGIIVDSVEVFNSILITGEGDTIYITGNFEHVIIDTTTLVVINGNAERITIIKEDAQIELVNSDVSVVHVHQNAMIFGIGRVNEVIIYRPEINFILDVENKLDVEIDIEMTTNDPTPTPIPTPSPAPTLSNENLPVQVPVSTIKPMPTSIPQTPAPPTTTPTPTIPPNIVINTPLLYESGYLVLHETIRLDTSDPRYALISQLQDGDEVLLSGGDITGAKINSPSTIIDNTILTNPTSSFGLYLGSGVDFTLNGFIGNLSQLIVTGTPGSSVTIPSSQPQTTVSLAGQLNVNISGSGGSNFVFNPVGTVDLNITSVSQFFRMDLSGLVSDSTISYLGVSIEIGASLISAYALSFNPLATDSSIRFHSSPLAGMQFQLDVISAHLRLYTDKIVILEAVSISAMSLGFATTIYAMRDFVTFDNVFFESLFTLLPIV